MERALRRNPAERPSHQEIRDAFRLALGATPPAPMEEKAAGPKLVLSPSGAHTAPCSRRLPRLPRHRRCLRRPDATGCAAHGAGTASRARSCTSGSGGPLRARFRFPRSRRLLLPPRPPSGKTGAFCDPPVPPMPASRGRPRRSAGCLRSPRGRASRPPAAVSSPPPNRRRRSTRQAASCCSSIDGDLLNALAPRHRPAGRGGGAAAPAAARSGAAWFPVQRRPAAGGTGPGRRRSPRRCLRRPRRRCASRIVLIGRRRRARPVLGHPLLVGQ